MLLPEQGQWTYFLNEKAQAAYQKFFMKSSMSLTDLFFSLQCVINIGDKECLTHSLILGKLVRKA